jgi:hypothetical protein
VTEELFRPAWNSEKVFFLDNLFIMNRREKSTLEIFYNIRP